MRRIHRSIRSIPSQAHAILALAAVVALAGATARGSPPDESDDDAMPMRGLGPADGHDLPPTDTGRVAIGDTAPDFTLLDANGEPVTLSELRGRRVLLAFYRGHW